MENRCYVCYPNKGIWVLVHRKVIFVDFIHMYRGFILKSAELKFNHVVLVLNHCILVGIFEVKVSMNSLCSSCFKPFSMFFLMPNIDRDLKWTLTVHVWLFLTLCFLFIVVLILILFLFPYWRDIIITDEPIKFVYYV